MGIPVRILQDTIDSREWAGWKAYYSLEPFGPLRDDLRAGVIAASILNLFRGQNTQPIRPEDIFTTLQSPEAEQTTDNQLALVEMLNAAFGGLDTRKAVEYKPLEEAKGTEWELIEYGDYSGFTS